jgi:hypothetical protein
VALFAKKQMPPVQVPPLPHWLDAVHAAHKLVLLLHRLLVQSEFAEHAVPFPARQRPPRHVSDVPHCAFDAHAFPAEARQAPFDPQV